MARFGGAPAASQAQAGQRPRSATPAAQRRIVRHNVTNIRFESLTPNEAVVASYFTVITEIGLDHMGRYRDRFVPVGDRWLIAHRFVSTDWRSPDTTFGGPVAGAAQRMPASSTSPSQGTWVRAAASASASVSYSWPEK